MTILFEKNNSWIETPKNSVCLFYQLTHTVEAVS